MNVLQPVLSGSKESLSLFGSPALSTSDRANAGSEENIKVSHDSQHPAWYIVA